MIKKYWIEIQSLEEEMLGPATSARVQLRKHLREKQAEAAPLTQGFIASNTNTPVGNTNTPVGNTNNFFENTNRTVENTNTPVENTNTPTDDVYV